MGKTIQAISLIVTHRSDDMARIVLPAGAAVAASNDDARPKLKLRVAGAPPPPRAATKAEPSTNATEPDERKPADVCMAPPPGGQSGGQRAKKKKKATSADPMKGIVDPRQADARSTANQACCASAGPSTSAPAWCKATLVICPLVAVIQWRGEIARYTAPGSVKARSFCYTQVVVVLFC